MYFLCSERKFSSYTIPGGMVQDGSLVLQRFDHFGMTVSQVSCRVSTEIVKVSLAFYVPDENTCKTSLIVISLDY